jgi:hypothetical protein
MVDLLSRINGGVFSIPPFYDAGHALDRRADKVCIMVHLLRQRFGGSLQDAPLSLMRFAARAEFRYGVRSIAHLVSMIPHRRDVISLRVVDLHLPLETAAKLKNSSLAYHLLHQDQAFGVEKLWKEASENDFQMPVNTDLVAGLPAPAFIDPHYSSFLISRILSRLEATTDEARKAAGHKRSPNKALHPTAGPPRARRQ